MAKALKQATLDSAKFSRGVYTKHRVEPSKFASPVDITTPARKVHDSRNVLPPSQLKIGCDYFKYTYTTWICYFFGKFDRSGNFEPGPSVSQPRGVFIFASLLAEGICLPLAPLYLVFLQCFLYERFPEYNHVRVIPDPPQNNVDQPPEPRCYGSFMGSPRHYLLDLIDDEDECVQRPYTLNFFPGLEGLDPIYQEDHFVSRNNRNSRVEARQFGLDQPPCDVGVLYCDVSEAMHVVMFLPSCSMSLVDPTKFTPTDRVAREAALNPLRKHKLSSAQQALKDKLAFTSYNTKL
ncbi:hypothetical protein SESBI_24944 [Sesbania bispinosa]|nr:hypothetical protein SESBI_24944 [Sesbania bispinosa]